MIKKELILGVHMSIGGGLENALVSASKYRCGCVQMFLFNQRQWDRVELTDGQVEVFRRVRRQTKIRQVAAHSSYLINLAAADNDILRKSKAALADEYARCGRLGIEYLVLHPGSHVGQGESKGLAKVVAGVNRVLAKSNDSGCQILFETTAGQGSCLGHSFEQLAYLLEQVEASERMGVCLDTCHIFAAGYDVRSEGAYRETIGRFDDVVGLGRLKVVHVNDSKRELGSRVDRHEHIGKGLLGRDAFRYFVKDRRLRGAAFILETPKGKSTGGRDMDMLNLAALRRLAR